MLQEPTFDLLIFSIRPAIIRAATQGVAGDTGDAAGSRTTRALNGIGLEGLRRLLNTGRLQFRSVGDDDDDSGLFYGGSSRRGLSTRMSEFWEPVKEPIQAGTELLYGGEFGRPPARPPSTPKSRFSSSQNLTDTISSRRKALRRIRKQELSVSLC